MNVTSYLCYWFSDCVILTACTNCLCTHVLLCSTVISGIQRNFIFLLQGVEFFDEKLNSLCMTWLVDHGKQVQIYNLVHSHISCRESWTKVPSPLVMWLNFVIQLGFSNMELDWLTENPTTTHVCFVSVFRVDNAGSNIQNGTRTLFTVAISHQKL